jgi:hypothetical protein
MTGPVALHHKRQLERTTANLRKDAKRKRFAPGDYYNNRAGDIIRIDDVNTFSIWGTLWKRYNSGKWVCYGTRTWRPDGRYFDASFDSLEDLTTRTRKPAWLEGVAA